MPQRDSVSGTGLHIVQGGVENGDKAWLVRAAGQKLRAKQWIVPSTVKVGDDVVIFVGGFGFFATARVASAPWKRTDWKHRYSARLEEIRLIEPAISIGAIRRAIPKLTWANYPRSITTPSRKIASEIRRLIARRRDTRLPDLDADHLHESNLAELRAVALMKATSSAARRSTSATYRIREAAIRLYVLARAGGSCEGCRADAPFARADGAPYLEPHHTTRLADDGPDHPARVIALCPNCHRRAHYSGAAKAFNDSLKKKLHRLEGA